MADLGSAANPISTAYLSTSIGLPASGSVSTTELGYVTGVTSAIQTQINTANTNISTANTNISARKFLQFVYATTGTVKTTSSSTYALTNLVGIITPSATTSKVLIVVCGALENAVQSNQAQLSLDRNGTDLTSNGRLATLRPSAAATTRVMSTFFYVDSPSSTSALTYTALLKATDNLSNVSFPSNAGEQAAILLVELGV
jgi:hypothetical protein